MKRLITNPRLVGMATGLAVIAALVVLVWAVAFPRLGMRSGGAIGRRDLLEAFDLPAVGRVYQILARAAAGGLTSVSGYFSSAGWQAGLRTGLASQVVATLGWAVVLGLGSRGLLGRDGSTLGIGLRLGSEMFAQPRNPDTL